MKCFEKFSLEAYQDKKGVWTVGWGHTKDVKAGMKVTRSQAETFFSQDAVECGEAVEKLVKVKLDDNEFAALVSLSFNIGLKAVEDSQLLKKLNAGDKAGAADEFELSKAGEEGDGWKLRRKAERLLFLSKTNDAGRDLIKDHEGLKLKTFKAKDEKLTIGYGHSGKVDGEDIKEGMKITPEQAQALFNEDVYECEKVVKSLVKVKLNENEFAALVSLTFDVPSETLSSSTLLKKLNAGDKAGAVKEFPGFTKPKASEKGVDSKGLARRREGEASLFLESSNVYVTA